MQVAFGNQFIFRAETAVFDQVQVQSGQRYARQERLGMRPVLQNLGPDTDTASLPGVIFACWLGDAGSLDTLRSIKEAGVPQSLWTVRNGIGVPYLPGRWVIDGVSETRSDLRGGGKPQKIEWTLNLLRYD